MKIKKTQINVSPSVPTKAILAVSDTAKSVNYAMGAFASLIAEASSTTRLMRSEWNYLADVCKNSTVIQEIEDLPFSVIDTIIRHVDDSDRKSDLAANHFPKSSDRNYVSELVSKLRSMTLIQSQVIVMAIRFYWQVMTAKATAIDNDHDEWWTPNFRVSYMYSAHKEVEEVKPTKREKGK